VLDALLCLIQTCRWTSPLPPPQHCRTNADTTLRSNENRVIRNDENNNDNNGMFIPHRFQPTNIMHHKNTTRMIALTFGMGATLDLVAASTTEMEQYPYVCTWAVVGAAHFYLINAIYVVVVASTHNKVFCYRTGLSSSQSITYIADRLFLMGSIVDVALSYFYIGENWDSNRTVWVYIYRGYLFSALLWLLNAIMYIVADIGMKHPNRMFHHNVLLDDTSSRVANVESTAVVSPNQQQFIKTKQRFEPRYYSHHQYDTPRNIDPDSLLFDHSLSLHETTRMTTAATESLPDDTASVTTSTTSTLSFLPRQ
jgi:hypothetical protein